MSKAVLANAVAKRTGQSRRGALATIETFLECVTDELGGRGKVRLGRFGTFRVRTRAARTGVDIRTGKPRLFLARRTVTFKPGATLRRAIR